MSVNKRREFLKKTLLGTTGAVVAPADESTALTGKTGEKRYAMVIDLRRCYGCHACSVACKSEHNVNLGAFRSYVNQIEIEHGRGVTRYFVPRLCNHCKHPACTRVCPVEATYIREDGVVMIRKERCIGCRYCIVACPYGSRSFKWNRGEKESMNWPSRKYGTADKCDFCAHRLDNGVEPACVNTCPARARIFGDLNDPDSEVSKIIAATPVNTLATELGTGPSVYYIDLHESAAQASLEVNSKLNLVRKELPV